MEESEKSLTHLDLPSLLSADSLWGTPRSPTSPTHLLRKSQIKRQMSSTHTIHESVSLSKVGSSWIGGEDGMFSINRVPGGCNKEESNEIEALRKTNLAVQKATSRRLSTPKLVKLPSSLFDQSAQRAFGRPEQPDWLRALILVAERTKEEDSGSRSSADCSSITMQLRLKQRQTDKPPKFRPTAFVRITTQGGS
ncbi:hypothetical protein PtA15_1A776 [Puccinia triticina]|uniref:Uncharacterized protein n=1 Tax=Puccinia triticina TaxID=208348 RepID=A0ABY7C9G0_9BASI|nr:uncharacterized protein PtA15_1A776 [Puccinia triticina]WAQ81435.1 hypothetical protein PtA15_1A776 [Puccinia triticina]